MRQKMKRQQGAAERTIKDIRRPTHKHYSSEEKIRTVLAGLRGEDSIAELCRQEGIPWKRLIFRQVSVLLTVYPGWDRSTAQLSRSTDQLWNVGPSEFRLREQ